MRRRFGRRTVRSSDRSQSTEEQGELMGVEAARDEITQITTTAEPRLYGSAHKALYAAAEAFTGGTIEPGSVRIGAAPWSLEMYPTMACNIACVHCYAQLRNEEYGFSSMPVDMMDRLHASIRGMGVRGVQYCGGGEPTLWRGGRIADYIATLPLATTRAGMASNIVKGACLAKPDVLEKMTFIEVAVFAFDNASYAAVAGKQDTHDKVQRSLDKILAARQNARLSNPFINAKILINNINYRWLPQIYDWAAGAGFDNIHMRLVDDYENIGGFVLSDHERVEFGETLAEFAQHRGLPGLRDQLGMILGVDNKGASGEHRHCWTVSLGLNCWVLANGEVYACGPQWGRPEYQIGDLRHADLEEIWGGSRHQQVAALLTERMAASRCYATGCRHIKQSIAIDAMRAGTVAAPPQDEFAARHAWFL
jgi:radical SAM protein with 4Fe4S-binding SPASM domain